MPPSGILHRVALVKADIRQERLASIIRVRRIGELVLLRRVLLLLVTANVPSSLILFTPMMEKGWFFRNVGNYKSHMAKHP
jgi:hypothetical protein